MAQPIRTNNFDFLRLIGAVLVIYGHSYPLTGSASPGFAGNAVGTIGVKIFFVISGYLIAQSWLRDPALSRFLLRRCLRIFPALVVVILLSIIVLGPLLTILPLSQYFRSHMLTSYLWNIALYINYGLPEVFAHNVYPDAVNGSLWSLPCEFFMYLLTPILLSQLFNRQKFNFLLLTALLTLASLILVRAIPRQTQLVVYGTSVWSWLEVAPYFLIGMVFAIYQLERFVNIYVAFAGLLALSVFETGATAKEAMLMLVLPYGCLAFGLGYAPAFARLTRGNDLSYGVFLFGFPVQQTLSATLGPQIGAWANCLAALVICIGLAYLSWNFIERPMLGWKPSRKVLQPVAGAAG